MVAALNNLINGVENNEFLSDVEATLVLIHDNKTLKYITEGKNEWRTKLVIIAIHAHQG